MLPTSNINSPNFDDWWSGAQFSRAGSLNVTDVTKTVEKYKITKQRIAGRWVYNRYDCEDAIVKINAMRAERAAKQSATS